MGRPTKRTDAARSTTGRPTKRTQQAMERITEAIREGATLGLAAAIGGIHYDTFNEWRKAFSDFSEMVDQAVAESAIFHLRNVNVHSAEDWRASAWILEHRFPDEFGKSVQQQQVSGEVNHTVRITYVNDWRAATFQAAESDADANVVEAIVAPAVTAASGKSGGGGVEEERDGSR